MSAGRTCSEATVAFSLGSNLGVREEHLLAAVSGLSRIPGVTIEAVSSLYETSPIGIPTRRNFVNAACLARTAIPPRELLALCKGIERHQGRNLDAPSTDRTLDIDILVYGDAIIAAEGLEIPHPRMGERLFVLVPLAEICPNLTVPPLGTRVSELRRKCAGGGWVRKISARSDTLNFLKTKKLE